MIALVTALPLLLQTMLKVPAMILGVKGTSNQHCIAMEGECANLQGFCKSVSRLLARIVVTTWFKVQGLRSLQELEILSKDCYLICKHHQSVDQSLNKQLFNIL